MSQTASNRLPTLDVARGLAIFGILFANIAAFSGPEFFATTMHVGPESFGWNMALLTFVSGKFRGMLAILFGIGLAMQFGKRKFMGQPWPGTYLRRTALLAGIGLAHGVFLWSGDILLTYAITAFIVAALVDLKDFPALKVALILAGVSMFLGLGLAAAGPFMADLGPAGGVEREKAAMMGDWLSRLQFRALFQTKTIMSLFFFLPQSIGLFLYGFWLARAGVVADPVDKWYLVQRHVAWGLGLGFPLTVLMAWAVASGRAVGGEMLIELGLNMMVAPALLLLVFRWVHSQRAKALAEPFRRMGRIALTCYLLQTVMCTAYYYEWGLGYYNRTEWPQDLMVVLGVNAILLIFAWFYSGTGRQGPVEALWRRFAEPTRPAVSGGAGAGPGTPR
ncbi:MAG TPA: DUF418 domain-containing protein [Fimbriimonadaceae bacterium]|nr:hypothetical protein [Armatimonadota bacterium]HRI74523.1 DUF418 domain-containing protein [Fimbriimonadaceae bacterium]